MIKIKPSKGRTWLTAEYKGQEINFAYPGFEGSRRKVFEEINSNNELRPAEGIELALLSYCAYEGNGHEWKAVRDSFLLDHVLFPSRNLWIPKGQIPTNENLSGVLVERDTGGSGLSTRMSVPDISTWILTEEGLYISPDKRKIFAPKSSYSEEFEKDGFAIATLTVEGARLYNLASGIANNGFNDIPEEIRKDYIKNRPGVIPTKKATTIKVDVDKLAQPDQRTSNLVVGFDFELRGESYDDGGFVYAVRKN